VVLITSLIFLSVDFTETRFSIGYYTENKIDGFNIDTNIANGATSGFSFLQKDSDKKFEDIEDFIQKKVFLL